MIIFKACRISLTDALTDEKYREELENFSGSDSSSDSSDSDGDSDSDDDVSYW